MTTLESYIAAIEGQQPYYMSAPITLSPEEIELVTEWFEVEGNRDAAQAVSRIAQRRGVYPSRVYSAHRATTFTLPNYSG